jgi:hypothetical protein
VILDRRGTDAAQRAETRFVGVPPHAFTYCSQPYHRYRRLHADRSGGICKSDARWAFRRMDRFGQCPYGGTPKKRLPACHSFVKLTTLPPYARWCS